MLPKVSFIHWTDRAFFYDANGNTDSIKKTSWKRGIDLLFFTTLNCWKQPNANYSDQLFVYTKSNLL